MPNLAARIAELKAENVEQLEAIDRDLSALLVKVKAALSRRTPKRSPRGPTTRGAVLPGRGLGGGK